MVTQLVRKLCVCVPPDGSQNPGVLLCDSKTKDCFINVILS
jgi:hypothetical protein